MRIELPSSVRSPACAAGETRPARVMARLVMSTARVTMSASLRYAAVNHTKSEPRCLSSFRPLRRRALHEARHEIAQMSDLGHCDAALARRLAALAAARRDERAGEAELARLL